MAEEKKKLKQFPPLRSDEEAEHFVDTADLSEYDFSKGRRVQYIFEKKSLEKISEDKKE